VKFLVELVNKTDEELDIPTSLVIENSDVRPVVGDKLQFWGEDGNTLYIAIIREVSICFSLSGTTLVGNSDHEMIADVVDVRW